MKTSVSDSSHPSVTLKNYWTFKCFPYIVWAGKYNPQQKKTKKYCKNLESLKCHFSCIELYEITVKHVTQFYCGILKKFQCSLEKSKVHETFSKCGKPLWLPFMVIQVQGFCKTVHTNINLFSRIRYTIRV